MQVAGRPGGKGVAFLVTLSGLKTLQDIDEGGGGWRAVQGAAATLQLHFHTRYHLSL